jgi:hypothetical protein
MPVKPTMVTAMRRAPTASPRITIAITTMIRGRENWIVTVSPIDIWINARKKHRLPMNPTNPRIPCM